jgi:UMF1 family MFS transporter
MTPESRSAEFFAFFGFISRASAVIGPIVYLLVTGVSDSRVAVLVILLMILAGTATLRWVDVGEGRSVAENEDARHLAAHAATDESA